MSRTSGATRLTTARNSASDGVKGLMAVGAITLFFWSVDAAGVTDLLNGWANDCLVRSVARWHDDRANVLLIYVERQRLTAQPESLGQLIHRLGELGARGIGCTFPADDVDTALPDLGELNKWLFFAADEGLVDETHPDVGYPLPSQGDTDSEQGGGDATNVGLISLLPTRDGICRDHYIARFRGDRAHVSLEGAMASCILVDGDSIPEGVFGVNFRGGVNSLPFFHDTDVLDGRLVRNLVDGKVVLIGYHPDAWSPGVMTPTTGETRMPRLEFHGHVMNTLILRKPLWSLSGSGNLLVLLITGLIGYGVNRRIDLRWTIGFTTLSIVALWGCAWGTLFLFRMRIPFASLVGIQLMCLLAICDHRFRLSRATLSRLLMQQTVKTQVLRAPTNFASSLDPWSDLSDFIYQLFYLNRMVIFKLQSGHQYVVPVKAVNCELGEMAERRRDFRRPPFAEALESKSPVRVDAKDFVFFRRHRQDETQFLAAATYHGQLMGFLAVDVTADSLDTFQDFNACLQRMADEVGTLLAHRHGVQSGKQVTRWTRFLTEVPEQPLISELDRTNRSLERRISCLEHAFEGATSATAIYDLFGRTLLINREMFQIMQDRGTVPAEMTAVELLAVLSGRDWNQCRRLLRNVVMFHRNESILAAGPGHQTACVLYLRPLSRGRTQTARNEGDVEPFQLQGIHFELLDGSALADSLGVKDRITDRLCATLTDRLNEVRSAIARLRDGGEEAPTRQRIGADAEMLIGDTVGLLNDCQTFLESSPSSVPEDRVPVNVAAVVTRVIEIFKGKAELRGITMDVALPDPMGDVLANPQLIQRMFEVIVELLVANARDYSRVRITVEDQASTIGVTFENEGSGTSVDRIRAALSDEHVSNLDEFRRLKELRNWIEQWEGHMVVSTEMGTGIAIKLALQKYLWGTHRQSPKPSITGANRDRESPKSTSGKQDRRRK